MLNGTILWQDLHKIVLINVLLILKLIVHFLHTMVLLHILEMLKMEVQIGMLIEFLENGHYLKTMQDKLKWLLFNFLVVDVHKLVEKMV